MPRRSNIPILPQNLRAEGARGVGISPLPHGLVTPWAPIMRKGVVDRPRRASRNPHACLGGSPQETRWFWPCVCVSLSHLSMCLKCRSDFATLTRRTLDGTLDGTHTEQAAFFLPSFLCPPCGTSAWLVIEPGGFPWNPGTRAAREGRGPSRITFGGRHQKGVDHFRSVVSGYAAQPRRCSSQLDMLVLQSLRRTFCMRTAPHLRPGGSQATSPG